MRVKLGRYLTFLVTFLNPIAVNLTNVVSHLCKHGGTQAFYKTKHGRRHWFAITPVSFQTAILIGLILRHNVGVIILDTDTSHGIGGSYAESVTVAWDYGT